MYKADKSEPFWWGMFSAGGVVAALLVPIHLILDGLAAPLGLAESGGVGARMQALIANPLVKIYVFVLIVLPLYHAAHRLRFTLAELGLKADGLLSVLFYGGALLGTVATAYVLLQLS